MRRALAAAVPVASGPPTPLSTRPHSRSKASSRRPGSDSDRCSGGNTEDECLTIRNYSRTAKVNLKGYVVQDATGNRFTYRRQPHP